MQLAEPRATCLQCRRAAAVCVCTAVHPLPSRTRVVFLQHPREAHMPVSTCRLAHLSLPGSELHIGLGAEGNPRLEGIARAPGTMVLFPGPGAVDVRDLPAPPDTLLVVDGTWVTARTLIERSPLLAALPRVAFTPERPSNYRIRREPLPTCVSTIEAVAHILDALEGTPGRYTPILGAFDRMVDQQLVYIAARSERTRRSKAPRRPDALVDLEAIADRAVLTFAEGDPWARKGDPPVLHRWVAARWRGPERFEAQLGPAARHATAPISIEGRASAVARWQAFLRPDDVLVSWGEFTARLLHASGLGPTETRDAKRIATNRMHRPLGGVEAFAEARGASLPGRDESAERRVLALRHVLDELVADRR